MEKDFDELIRIDDESKKNEDLGFGKKLVPPQRQKKPLDFFDPNYRPPDYHTEDEWELFKA